MNKIATLIAAVRSSLKTLRASMVLFFDTEAAERRAHDAYLADASSIADLEARDREWDRRRSSGAGLFAKVR